MSSYKGPARNKPSVPVVVSSAASPLLNVEILLSLSARTRMLTFERGGETDPSMYNPSRPENGAIGSWQPSFATET